ncbi:MAG: hypothetical protein OEY38_07685 [Gammaproteobacteria bacterium]|nr:hypothetical protein [Gammaproteobacteria bacterium]
MSQIGLQLVRTLPIYLLVGFQAFRIPVELLIHQAANAGLAPMEMTYFGRNFDIISGLSAIVLALFLFRRVISAKILLLWNVLAMALLTNVVVVAILSMPHPLQVLNTDPANVWVTYSPFILLPGVLVCSAFFGHLLVFRYLRQFNHNPAFRAESRLC